MNDPLAELEASKLVINDMFRDLLIGKKAFKYQITIKNYLSKQKENDERQFNTVFLSPFKTVIGSKYNLGKSF